MRLMADLCSAAAACTAEQAAGTAERTFNQSIGPRFLRNGRDERSPLMGGGWGGKDVPRYEIVFFCFLSPYFFFFVCLCDDSETLSRWEKMCTHAHSSVLVTCI